MRERATMNVTLPRPNDLDGSSQLDEILNELLNEAGATSPKKQQPWLSDGKGGRALEQQSGSITTQSGNSRTVISWQTSQATPKTSTLTSTLTSTPRRMNADGAGGGKSSNNATTTWNNQTVKTESRSWKEETETAERERAMQLRREKAMSPSALHQLQREGGGGGGGGSTPQRRAMAVRTPPPPPARRRLISADELGVGMMESSSLLARGRGARGSDGEDGPAAAAGGGGGRRDAQLMRNCASDSEEMHRSWLDEQMWKLESKRSGKGKSYQQHSRLEKQLISDLTSHLVSTGKYTGTTTTQSDTDDNRATMIPPRQQQQQHEEEGAAEEVARPTGVRQNASSSDDVSARPVTTASTTSSSTLQRRVGVQQQQQQQQMATMVHDDSAADLSGSEERTMTRQREKVTLYATGSYDDVAKATTFDLGVGSVIPSGTLGPTQGGPHAAGASSGAKVKRGEPIRSLSLGDDPNRGRQGGQGTTYKTKASFFVSGIERPAFSTHQTKYTFSCSPIHWQDDDATGSLNRNKPPPPRSSAPTSPLIPKRGDSSREAVQRSQRKLVCSPTLDDLEQSLRLILEETNKSPTDKEKSVDATRKLQATPSRELVDDEVIVLKPIGPGVQTLEPEKDGTLRRRPMTPLIPTLLSGQSTLTNGGISSDPGTNQGPASPKWISNENVNPPLQPLGQFNQQLGQSIAQDQVNIQYSTLPLGSNNVIMTNDQQQQWLQRQQLMQQQQLQQQPLQHQQQQPLQQHQQPWQQPQQQQQSWQQQTWQRQQSWPLQQQQQQQGQPLPAAMMSPQSFGTLNRTQGVDQTAQVVSYQQLVQQQQQQQPVAAVYNVTAAAQQNVQPLFIGVQRAQSFERQGNTLPRQQNLNQHVFAQSVQQLNTQQLNAQQLNAQQLNAQQLNAQQLNAQLMGSQQQLNAQQSNLQQTGLYHTLPQFSVQQGVQHPIGVQQSIVGVQQPNVGLQQPIVGVQHPISVEQREMAKYMTYEQTLSSLPQQQVTVGQPQIPTVQQMGLAAAAQNQGQQMQQQMQQQQMQQQQMQQQQVQQQAYSQQVLRTSSTVDQGSRTNTLQNGTQGGVGGSLTLDSRTRSPAFGGGMSPGGSWPSQSVGYGGDTLRSQTLQMKRTAATVGNSQETLLRATSPSSVYSAQMGNGGSIASLTDGSEFTNTMPRFVRDTSKYWHKPNISRDEAISLLKDKPAGSFVVRNSTTFQGGYGLALKVAQLPPNVQAKGDDLQANLVRHFLIESSSKGVRLKGCSNEPVFGSLAQLVYQHSITPLALPCKLLLPGTESGTLDETDKWNSDANLLAQGPACNALYVDSVDTESLTGPEALSKAIGSVFGSGIGPPKTTSVQFKVTYQGITLTDNRHRLFFRRHYPLNTVTFCGIDGKDRRWTLTNEDNVTISGKLFGFVARKSGGNNDNACHLFLDADKNQSSASAIVGLMTKVMMGQGQFMKT